MPKVTEEYFIEKKKEIADAAYRVCLKKPVSTVTMTDIIRETKLSQGGIYRFYSCLDDILSAMIGEMRKNFNLIEDTDRIFDDCEKKSTREFCEAVCDVLAERMEKNLMTLQKINFDLSVLAINEPERAANILKNVPNEGNMEHLTKATFGLLLNKMGSGDCKPRVSPEVLTQFIACSYSGIEMNCIIDNCYKHGPNKTPCSPRPLFKALAITIAYLLGEN